MPALSLVRTSADTKALREFLATLPAAFIECRRYGHAWTGETVEVLKGGYKVHIKCLRCTSTATERLDKAGYRDGKRAIKYVEGYLAKGHGRVTKEVNAIVRLEELRLISA